MIPFGTFLGEDRRNRPDQGFSGPPTGLDVKNQGDRRAMLKKVPNPIDRHVGSRVRMRRMLAGVSQEKLGEALGLTFQQVQKYEKGTNRISARRLLQISKMLGVPVAFFFDGAPTDETVGNGFADASGTASGGDLPPPRAGGRTARRSTRASATASGSMTRPGARSSRLGRRWAWPSAPTGCEPSAWRCYHGVTNRVEACQQLH